MATLHPARATGCATAARSRRACAPTSCCSTTSRSFRAARVCKDGRLVAADGARRCRSRAPPVPDWVRSTMRTAPVGRRRLRDPGARVRARARDRDRPGPADHARARGGAHRRDGRVVADPARDLAKIAVVERHHATGRIGLGLVRGFGLRAGAFASTVAHDAHNIVVVGVADDDMARVRRAPARDRRRHRRGARRRRPRRARRCRSPGCCPTSRPRTSSSGSRSCRPCCASRASATPRRS